MTVRHQHPAPFACLDALRAARGEAAVERTTDVARWAAFLAKQQGWHSDDQQRLADTTIVREVGEILADAPSPCPSITAQLDDEQRSWLELHTEHWDGSGPKGLRGLEIPEGARILGLVIFWQNLCRYDFTGGSAPLAECWRLSGTRLWPDGVRALTRFQTLSDGGKPPVSPLP